GDVGPGDRRRARRGLVAEAHHVGAAPGGRGRDDGKDGNPCGQARAGHGEGTHGVTHSKRYTDDERVNPPAVNNPLISAAGRQTPPLVAGNPHSSRACPGNNGTNRTQIRSSRCTPSWRLVSLTMRWASP